VLIGDHGPAARATGFVPEPLHIRLAGMIAAYRRHGSRYEGRIDQLNGQLWDHAQSLDPLPPWMAGITVRLSDGDHVVYPEPPPENPKRPEPLPLGVREPVTVEPAAIRTPETQRAIDDTKRGYEDLEMAGIPPRSTSADYMDEPLGDGGEP
jgi:hypothetical protein